MDRRVDLNHFRLRDVLGDVPVLASAERVIYHDYRDFRAGIASGSFLTEGMIVCQDVLQIDPAEARKVKSWAVRALVKMALQESKPGGNAEPPSTK
jgi:hypothetical protein